MKVILRGYGIRMKSEERYVARSQAADMTLTRGTSRPPQPPRDIICQPSANAILVTWNYPVVNADIQRWRVYRDTESNLYAEIKDRGTRQCLVGATSGTPSPVTNIFISSMNNFGVESAKVQVQGSALISASTVAVPTPPPEYGKMNSGGLDKRSDYVKRGRDD